MSERISCGEHLEPLDEASVISDAVPHFLPTPLLHYRQVSTCAAGGGGRDLTSEGSGATSGSGIGSTGGRRATCKTFVSGAFDEVKVPLGCGHGATALSETYAPHPHAVSQC
jgi:hypothetical protein